MVNQLLLALVNSVLGVGKPTANNNYAYHCPFCHHVKPKLEVNLMENKEGNIDRVVFLYWHPHEKFVKYSHDEFCETKETIR